MIKKTKILNSITNGFNRIFKIKILQTQTVHAIQYNSGGDDYCPADNLEAITAHINNNPKNTAVFAYKDNVEKISKPGEKRIYALNAEGTKVMAEIHLMNNGDIVIKPTGKIISTGNWEHTGNINITGDISQTGNINLLGFIAASNVVDNSAATGIFKEKVIVENGIVKEGI